MIDPKSFADLATLALGPFADKPTRLTESQQEASTPLWSAEDGRVKIGIWECTPGSFTADRSQAGEYCHILSGRARVRNADGSALQEVGPGDLLVLPQGWVGEWEILTHLRKLYVITALGA